MPIVGPKWSKVTYDENRSITDVILESAAKYGDNAALVSDFVLYQEESEREWERERQKENRHDQSNAMG